MVNRMDINLYFISDFMDVDTFETRGVTVRNYYLKAGDAEAYIDISKQTIIDSFDFLFRAAGGLSAQGILHGMVC